MAQVCFSCGKKSIRGHLVSHAKNRVVRSFKVNLQGFWVMEKGRRVRAKFCVKCLRRIKGKVGKVTPIRQYFEGEQAAQVV